MTTYACAWFLSAALLAAPATAQNTPNSAQSQNQSARQTALSSGQQVIPEGTVIQLSLREPLSSKLSEVGDEVLATVRRDVVVDGQTLIRQGTEVVGRVTVAKPARMPLKGGLLHLTFERIKFEDGLERKLSTSIQSASNFTRDEKIKSDSEGTLKGGKNGGDVLRNVGIGAGLGSAAATIIILSSADRNSTGLGSITRAGSVAGASAVGAGVVAGILLTKGKEVRLDSGTVVRLKLERALVID